MWTIPSVPSGAHDIDIHRPERSARPGNDPNRRSDRRRSRHPDPRDQEDEFEIDTFEPHSEEAANE